MSRPPMFNGTRSHFIEFVISFSGWVAYKLSDCTDILDETETEPIVPDPVIGAAGDVTNQVEIDLATTSRADWSRRNRRLYGAILQAVPAWLRTSIYASHRNDGLGAIQFLHGQFNANDANDHATQLSRLQTSYVDPSADLSEDDVRLQHDAMMVV